MSTSKPSSSDIIPFLEPGDRLSRDEFERRYSAMPNVKKAELIEGVVFMPSPVRLKAHAKPHSHLITWLGYYDAYTPCATVADNGTARLDLDNEPQPDAMLFLESAKRPSATTITSKGHRNWSPKCRAAARASTCTPRRPCIAATASASTWCGACWIGKSIGSRPAGANSCR
jgi:hypothetical protein